MGITLLTTIIVFLTVVLSLVGILLFAKAKLSPGGKVKLVINGQKEVEVDAGQQYYQLWVTTRYSYLQHVVAVELVPCVNVRLLREVEKFSH